ncbi:hypothetical protein [Prosthecobacter sp.]|uniref:hypothetical protein n=1 Tax=Prosthecobacter sp. TaxID=1965333 RepID=UPI002ABAEC27|nr:hypothetical protein [Prosthecobacter sp.]MDZ4401048.1 hypothetical protein [Prosthecobacter sp.]
MWPFKNKQPKKSVFDNPRYKENPIYLFFEDYILDVMGHLPSDKIDSIQAMNLQKIFSTQSSQWRDVIREVLHLSATIDIAILDLWIRNQSCYDDTNQGYLAFAQDFTDRYMADDSKIDVWPDGALETAKERIKQYQSQ